MNTRVLKSATDTIEGHGIHSGQPSRLRIVPAEPGSGLRFRRIDLNGSPELTRKDLVNNAAEGGRSTLQRGEAKVQTVEHVCAAIWGMGLDDALVEIEGIEPPAADGSALPFARALLDAGLEETSLPRTCFRPPTALSTDEGKACVSVLPMKAGLRLQYLLDYPGEPLANGEMSVEITPEVFLKEIAPARTFCPASQVEKFLALGWGQGANTANTLILEGETVKDNELRFPDEPLRHKLLDMVGDLSFLGGELTGHVRAIRSGHALNRKLLSRIITACEIRNGGSQVINVTEIRKMLPHRYPFLLVDRVIEVEPGKRAVGIKNLTVNEEFFQGHFPDVPVMPGVLQIEAMAQVGGILLAKTLDEGFDGQIAVLAGVDKAKLRRAVVPGDQLVIEITVDRLKRSFGQVFAKATVDGQVAAEATIKFAIVSPQNLSSSSKS